MKTNLKKNQIQELNSPQVLSPEVPLTDSAEEQAQNIAETGAELYEFDAAEGALPLEVRAWPLRAPKGHLQGFASVTIAGCFAVNGVQIMSGKNGLFVSMPSTKDSKGEYRDVCFPVTAQFRHQINEAVLGEFHAALESLSA
jgi:DNA-binding cell septation regulator SpoVG